MSCFFGLCRVQTVVADGFKSIPKWLIEVSLKDRYEAYCYMYINNIYFYLSTVISIFMLMIPTCMSSASRQTKHSPDSISKLLKDHEQLMFPILHKL